MSWNEPGGNKKDPWGNNNNDQGPPDLDELLKNLQNKLSSIFGGSGKSNGSDGETPNNNAPTVTGLIAAVALGLWLLSGFYIIDPAEKGVVTQFGRYIDTASSGPNWHIPYPIQQVVKVNVDQTRVVRLNAQSMLTKDENIVDVDISVQYNILDTKAYLFNVLNPDDTVRQVAESAIRETIGQNKMDVVITGGRSAIAAKTQEEIQEILDEYQTGIHIQTVNLQSAQPPEAVQAAFSDANKAREDKQRYINQAEAYRNEIIPLAKGQAKQELERAKGYKERVVKQAEGETQRFAKVLEQYTLAPEVTRERLYIEAVQEVLTNSSKVLIDSSGNNNLMYLPLDKMIGNRSGSVTQNTPNAFDSGISSQSFRPKTESQRSRLREIR